MDAPTLQEALARISHQLRHVFTLTPLPLASIAQNFKTSGCLAHHQAFPYPVGNLFVLHREYEIQLSTHAEDEYTHEKTLDDGKHKVLAEYGGLACEKTFSVSTLHNLGLSSCLKLYAGNSQKDSFCRLEACHNFNEFLVSSSYAEGLSSDPTVDFKFKHENGYFKVDGKFLKNLQNGLCHEHIESTAALPAEITLKNSVSTDFQGERHCRFEVARSSRDSNCLLRTLLGANGFKEVALQGGKSFWKTSHIEVSASSSYTASKFFSAMLEHKFGKHKKMAVNITSNSDGLHEASIQALFARDTMSWKCKYRKEDNSRHSVELKWEFTGDADGASSLRSLRIEGGNHGVVVNGEFRGQSWRWLKQRSQGSRQRERSRGLWLRIGCTLEVKIG